MSVGNSVINSLHALSSANICFEKQNRCEGIFLLGVKKNKYSNSEELTLVDYQTSTLWNQSLHWFFALGPLAHVDLSLKASVGYINRHWNELKEVSKYNLQILNNILNIHSHVRNCNETLIPVNEVKKYKEILENLNAIGFSQGEAEEILREIEKVGGKNSGKHAKEIFNIINFIISKGSGNDLSKILKICNFVSYKYLRLIFYFNKDRENCKFYLEAMLKLCQKPCSDLLAMSGYDDPLQTFYSFRTEISALEEKGISLEYTLIKAGVLLSYVSLGEVCQMTVENRLPDDPIQLILDLKPISITNILSDTQINRCEYHSNQFYQDFLIKIFVGINSEKRAQIVKTMQGFLGDRIKKVGLSDWERLVNCNFLTDPRHLVPFLKSFMDSPNQEIDSLVELIIGLDTYAYKWRENPEALRNKKFQYLAAMLEKVKDVRGIPEHRCEGYRLIEKGFPSRQFLSFLSRQDHHDFPEDLLEGDSSGDEKNNSDDAVLPYIDGGGELTLYKLQQMARGNNNDFNNLIKSWLPS